MESEKELHCVLRPFKITCDCKQFKGVVAKDLKMLKEKSMKSLGFEGSSDNIEIALEEDGTIIDDDEYFATLVGNTRLLIKQNEINVPIDCIDNLDTTDGITELSEPYNIPANITFPDSLKTKLSSKNSYESVIAFVTMPNDELEYLLECDSSVLMNELNVELDVVLVYKDNASRELLRRDELTQATQLLNLFQKAREASAATHVKRKREEVDG